MVLNMCIYVYVRVYMYVCKYVRMYVCMYVCVCICIINTKYGCGGLSPFFSLSNGVSHIQIVLLAPVCSKNFRHAPKHACSIAAFGCNKACKVEVKEKCTLVQALRLCTGRAARRGSRGIALPFHDHGTRRG